MVSTSSAPRHAFVWAWLPGSAEPVLAGQVRQRRAPAGRSVTTTTSYEFAYSQTYLARPDAISLFLPEVPLKNGWIDPPDGMSMAGCLRDGSPDSWGQRVIIDRLTGKRGQDADAVLLDELTYLLESGSNRIGGLDFQASSSSYVPRMKTATLDELHQAANALQAGTMTPELAAALARWHRCRGRSTQGAGDARRHRVHCEAIHFHGPLPRREGRGGRTGAGQTSRHPGA